MTIVGRDRLRTENKRLYHGDIDTGFHLIPDDDIPNHWRVIWPDGRKSTLPFNLVNGKENLYTLYLEQENKGARNSGAELEEAFK